MATAPEPMPMRSQDLRKKKYLDYGGFGEVYLCYHVNLGHVALKTVYTGPLSNEQSKNALFEEGKIMASLNHERVVKLLGVILENDLCALVMEWIPRGNLLEMLQKVSVPMPIKGRIILEILEGMVYLTEKHVIHKDIKPENILVDKDFHIKIADLGLATCKTWSKLTQKESRKKSYKGTTAGTRGAGTLSYMAPEHLKSIHTVSTEKSDIYSFAIVVWVILTNEEPYANARSEDHISQCVCNGDRPSEDLIPQKTPVKMIQLMKMCWDHCPEQRPLFRECYDSFLPFYTEELEPHIEEDLEHLRASYDVPDEFVEKMKSLSMTSEYFSADIPSSLVSTERSLSEPVEASIEDLHATQYGSSLAAVEPQIQTDARAVSIPSALEKKLDRELHYHKNGSYNLEDPPDATNHTLQDTPNASMPNSFIFANSNVRQPEQNRSNNLSSVQSWTKFDHAHLTDRDEVRHHPASDLYEPMTYNTFTASQVAVSVSTPSLSHSNQQHPHSHYDRQQSWPFELQHHTYGADVNPRQLLAPKNVPLQDQGSLYIQNARGIQIGNNNTLSIRNYDSPHNSSIYTGMGSTVNPIKEGILKYEDYAVTEEHLDVLRANIGAKWKHCARCLGLGDIEIEAIEHDFRTDGLREMVHQMLERWKMKEGSVGCIIGKLCQALEGNVKVEVIQKMLDICGSSSQIL